MALPHWPIRHLRPITYISTDVVNYIIHLFIFLGSMRQHYSLEFVFNILFLCVDPR